MKLSVILFLTAFAASSDAVINGQVWTDAPYVARIMYGLNPIAAASTAAGSIITDRHILTSASVIQPNFQVLNAFVGGVSRTTQTPIVISERRPHLGYQLNPRQNDIGILVTAIQMVFSRNVQPIALPGTGSFAPYVNDQGTAIGFGGWPIALSEHLNAAFMRAVDNVRCNVRHNFHQPNLQFCAEDIRLRSDICSEDLGGPFVVLQRGQEVLSGISSIAVCQAIPANPIEPSLFTRVSGYSDWIVQQINMPIPL